MISSNKGFTLIELLVVMAVFIIVIILTAQAFETILKQTGKLTKSEESNIEGIVGLEMFRHDLQQAGFGLPDSFLDSSKPPNYTESAYIPASAYNDAPDKIPRALAFGNDLSTSYSNTDANSETYTILKGTDYIAVKATTLGAAAPATNTNQKWTYVTSTNTPHTWPSENLTANDRVIVIKRSFTDSKYTNQLIYDTSKPATYWTTYSTAGLATAFAPTLATDIYYIYGISQDTTLGMPFNRSDFFVAKSSTSANVPTVCHSSTGTLYKGVVRHSGGNMDYIPLLDCVADMQVVLGWDLTDSSGSEGQDGVVETYSSADGKAVSGSSSLVTSALANPETLRNSLKIVKVYILAQIGRMDPNYTGPSSMVVGQTTESSLTRTYYFTEDMRHYHWKLYQLILRPQNLLSNQ